MLDAAVLSCFFSSSSSGTDGRSSKLSSAYLCVYLVVQQSGECQGVLWLWCGEAFGAEARAVVREPCCILTSSGCSGELLPVGVGFGQCLFLIVPAPLPQLLCFLVWR